MRVALVHYWLVGMRGGEKVLEGLCELFPDADIFTLVADETKLSATLKRHKITTSFMQKIGGKKHYQKMLPIMPMALEGFDLTDYDLVISSEAGPAKGVITRPDAVHVCYCHSPMRYIWDLYPQYYKNSGAITRLAMAITSPWLRTWDVTTAARVDHFVANSQYVAKRIAKFYRRSAVVINPPVDVARFSISETPEAYYLCAGQVTPYKKIELAVEACTRLNLPLVVLGSGVTPALRKLAGPKVTFLGAVDDETMARHFAQCRALLFPGVEDFGIVPLEVQASGRPVIAFARGGALETVKDNETGLHFHSQTTEGLIEAIERMEREHEQFDPERIRAHAMCFDRTHFLENLRNLFNQLPKSN